jgi:hypothetical protein
MISHSKYESMKEFVTYIHFYDGKPVFVGEGAKNRPFDKVQRSLDYRRFLEESDVEPIIVGNHGDKISARLNEQGLISWIGVENLFNKHRFFGQGMTDASPEVRERHRAACQNRVYNEEKRSRSLSLAAKRRIEEKPDIFEEFLRAGQESRRGSSHTSGTIIKMKDSALKRERKTCPHCDKTCAVNTYARWHGENCKHKP